MNQISVHKDYPLFLYRCDTCGAYWEEDMRAMYVVPPAEIRKTFPEVEILSAPPFLTAAALDEVISILFRIDLSRLSIRPTTDDMVDALDSWRWLGIDKFRPLLVTAFGDIFFDTPSGIQFLNTIDGSLKYAAEDMLNGLYWLLSSSDGREKWLLEILVRGAQARGQILAAGQCYDFKIPPALGGAMDVGNVHMTNFAVKMNIAGQMHRQAKALPPETRIRQVTIRTDGRGDLGT